MNSEIRKDYIDDRYVIIAPGRGRRPHDVKQESGGGQPSLPGPCHFCPERIDGERSILEIGDGRGWQIKVVPNKFPAVSAKFSKAYGAQEVVIETPHHTKQLDELPAAHISKLLEVYAARTAAITKDQRIQYVMIFKNSGGRAGATLRHSHSQIFAADFIPPQLKRRTGQCAYCDILRREQRGPRRVYSDDLVTAFTPYASQFGYEVWILPKRHVDNITRLTRAERDRFAAVMKKLLGKVVRLKLPYNYYFHQVVRNEDEHLYLKIVPRGAVWGPLELGIGLAINDVLPESAARYYRA